MEYHNQLSENLIISKIYSIRGLNVMIDRDLADLYGVKTKALKQAVKRNIERFPDDFMFEMSQEEFSNWRSQNVTSNADLMGLRYNPYCFTEQGVTMLSCILRSPLAIEVNIRVVRIFSRIRKMALNHQEVLLALEKIKGQLSDQDDNITLIFEHLKQLLNPPQKTRTEIGFKIGNS